MNKCGGIFGQILKVFLSIGVLSSCQRAEGGAGGEGIQLLGSNCGDAVFQLGQEMLRYNLLTYPDLWVWIDNPYETPLIVPDVEQLSLGVG